MRFEAKKARAISQRIKLKKSFAVAKDTHQLLNEDVPHRVGVAQLLPVLWVLSFCHCLCSLCGDETFFWRVCGCFNEEAAGTGSERVSTLVEIDRPSHLAPPDEVARVAAAARHWSRKAAAAVGTAGATT